MRVLVAEDVRRLADDIAEGLRDQGIAADVAYDGADAAAKLDLNPYDVLVLDRDLPGIHGDTLCRTITAAGHPVMILMLTAAGTPGDRVTGLASAGSAANSATPRPSRPSPAPATGSQIPATSGPRSQPPAIGA